MIDSILDLGCLEDVARKPGFALLYDENKTQVGHSPVKKIKNIPEKQDFEKNCNTIIGYLSYPNPKLKNKIPDSQFFGYSKMQTLKKVGIKEIEGFYKSYGKLEHSVTRAQYIKKIKEVKKLLAEGEIYQLNYAIRFQKKFEGSSYALFLRLIKENPTQFSAFLNCGDYQIISNSPERLFRVKEDTIITQPIKGTTTKKGGKRTLEIFLDSKKERAELDMITDLARNDVGRICKYRTLNLNKERELMELKNLYHTYSEVEGEIASGVKNKEVIKAMFPGGSITGCPKKRAMEYIEKLEKLPRNIFTGSIVIAESNYIDSNICIRTALVKDGMIEYWAGGGIVADSDPESEYEECLLKAEKFLGII